MRKITAMLLTLALLTGTLSIGAFADSGNGNGNENGQSAQIEASRALSAAPDASTELSPPSTTTPPAVTTTPTVTTPATVILVTPPAAEVNAAAEIALISRDAAKDLSIGNVEDNGDRIRLTDLRAFKSTFSSLFTELNKLRTQAKANWATLRSLNLQIRAAFDTFRNSLKSLPKEERDAKMATMKATLKTQHDLALPVHTAIQTLRIQKEQQWVNYRAAIKARNKATAETALKEIISLKGKIIEQQAALIGIKNAMLAAIKNPSL